MRVDTVTENFGFLTYKDEPVFSQRAIAPGLIEVVFYGKSINSEIVTEDEWNSFSTPMLMPRVRGRRAHVLRNWHEYKQYAIRRE